MQLKPAPSSRHDPRRSKQFGDVLRRAFVGSRTVLANAAAPNAGKYAPLVEEIHRRPAYALKAPAIMRHVSIRFRSEKDELAGRDLKDRRQTTDWLRQYIKSLSPNAPTLDDADAEQRSALFAVDFGAAARLRVRVEIHREYFSLTFVFDDFRLTDADDSSAVATAAGVLAQTQQIGSALDQGRAATFLYDEFWAQVEDRLRVDGARTIDEFFADFRGVALVPSNASAQTFFPQREEVENRRNHKVDEKVLQFAQDRERFLTAVLDLGQEESLVGDQDADVVMCGVLDGAAIYCSGLGGNIAGQWSPHRYLLIYNGLSDFELGRLARRVHVLGELRLAALLDLGGLDLASHELVKLGFEVDKITGELEENRNAVVDVIKLSSGLTGAGRNCVGGLVFRINQSRHYAQAYRERIQDLRIARIAGWQPYDDFVRRNLFKTYDRISRVLDRYTALSQRIERLGAVRLTQEIGRNTRKVGDQARELVWLQALGEPIAFVVFVKYAADLLRDVVPEGAHQWPSEPIFNWLCIHFLECTPPTEGQIPLFWFVLTAGLLYGLIRIVAYGIRFLLWTQR